LAEQAEIDHRESVAVLDSISEGVISLDPDGCCAYVNPSGARLLGYAAADLLGQHAAVLLRPGPGAEISPIALALEHGREVHIDEGLLWRQDGTAFAARYAVCPIIGRPGLSGAVLTFTDLTARKRVEQQLAQRAQLLELAHDAMIVRDTRGGSIIEWNRGAEELYGWTKDEAVGQREYAFLHTGFPRSREALELALETAGRWEGRLTHTQRDGTEAVVESRQVLLRDAQGAPTAILEINRDITERQALERLQQEFIAMISHELRNPLTAIMGYAQILQQRGTYDQRAVDVILGQTKHVARMVGDLLDAARLEAGRMTLQPASVDLVALVRASVAQARGLSERHALRIEAPDEPLTGSWDPGRLTQVLQNLLSNAVKYSPNGGEILISVRDLGGQVQVAVTDHGTGIAPELLPRLFGRFYRVAATSSSEVGGVGLGLYITRSLVEAHGGQLEAESTPGQGSTFRFTLPLVAPSLLQGAPARGVADE
jgi:PAS domain S-box-containing protein